MNGLIEELVLGYDPTKPAETLARRKRLFRGRLISLGITIVIMIIFFVWQRPLFGPALWILYGIGLAIGIIWAAVHLVGYLQARKVLAGLGSGVAVRVGRGGVQVGQLGAAWHDVVGLDVTKGGLWRSPEFRLRTSAGATSSVPLDQLATFPATLDSTARAYSGGRHGVDLSKLEN